EVDRDAPRPADELTPVRADRAGLRDPGTSRVEPREHPVAAQRADLARRARLHQESAPVRPATTTATPATMSTVPAAAITLGVWPRPRCLRAFSETCRRATTK